MQMLFKCDLKWRNRPPDVGTLTAGDRLRVATGNKNWSVDKIIGEITITQHNIASEHGFIGQLGAMQSLGVRGYIIIADSICSDLVRWDLTDRGVFQFGPLHYDLNLDQRFLDARKEINNESTTV